MAVPTWDELPKIEKDLLICAFEASGVLPYAGTRDSDGQYASDADVASAVLRLVDRGWVEVRRISVDTDVAGRLSNSYGPVIARADLDAVLSDPATWADPADLSWDGVVTLSETDAGRRITRAFR